MTQYYDPWFSPNVAGFTLVSKVMNLDVTFGVILGKIKGPNIKDLFFNPWTMAR